MKILKGFLKNHRRLKAILLILFFAGISLIVFSYLFPFRITNFIYETHRKLLKQAPTPYGIVLDENNQPLPDTTVSPSWEFTGGDIHPLSPDNKYYIKSSDSKLGYAPFSKSGKNGNYYFQYHWSDFWGPHWGTQLWAFNLKAKLGGHKLVRIWDLTTNYEINTSPLSTIKGHINCEMKLGAAHNGCGVRVLIHKEFLFWKKTLWPPFAIAHADENGFKFKLPKGNYKFEFSGPELYEDYSEIIRVSGDKDIDLKNIVLKESPIISMKGKSPPDWNIIDSHNIKPDTKIDDFKSKWLLIQFWGFS